VLFISSISQDSMIENRQNPTTFWDQVHNHFNESHLISCVQRYARSLETKWSIIQHDVAKFIGHYTVVLALCELGVGIEYTLQKVFDLYKKKHPKHQTLTFIHAWYVLKDIP